MAALDAVAVGFDVGFNVGLRVVGLAVVGRWWESPWWAIPWWEKPWWVRLLAFELAWMLAFVRFG